jgi:zinc finger BED domain-containing protein 5/7/8/9
VNPHVEWTHCFLHREALAARCMEPELKETLDSAVQIINLIKASAKNTRLFAALCQELDAIFTGLLLHTDVRWLSRGLKNSVVNFK